MKQADVIIVGGGIQGISLALATAKRGLTPLIVERTALGAGASGASYGIVHGGLRYLQTMNIRRWLRSRKAQTWYMEEFPSHVKPLRCVMPLYKNNFRSPLLFQAAIAMEQSLINIFDTPSPLPKTYLLGANQVLRDFNIPSRNLIGGACWHDAQVTDMPGLLRAMLMKAELDETCTLAPYEATELILDNNRVCGLKVTHASTGESKELWADVVVNCAGAWAGSWQDVAPCPTACTLAFNLLLDIHWPGDSALAVSTTPGKGRSYFIRPHAEGIFVGTYYRASPCSNEPVVSSNDIQDFINEMNLALPHLKLQASTVKAVTAGLLPDKDGSGKTLSSREQVICHKIQGFYSVLGGKFTTAPLLSDEAADIIWPQLAKRDVASGATLEKHHA